MKFVLLLPHVSLNSDRPSKLKNLDLFETKKDLQSSRLFFRPNVSQFFFCPNVSQVYCQCDVIFPSILVFQSACFIFINLGSRQDVRNIIDASSIFTSSSQWKPKFYIVDFRRPICPSYFFIVEPPASQDTTDEMQRRLIENSKVTTPV